ncbi:MAG: hypothetical protein ABSE82_08745, partial [Nitrososphaerales archaeon]
KVNYATTSLQSLTINSTQRKNRLFFCNGVILFTTELVSSSVSLIYMATFPPQRNGVMKRAVQQTDW